MKSNIADIRKDYQLQSFDESVAHSNPIEQFTIWWNEAVNSEILEVNAMTLATIDTSGHPDARIVLLKGYDHNGFVFFTNYNSNKGKSLEQDAHACLVFFWKELERQVRIKGRVAKITAQESDAYFFSRPIGSRIGAWASPQSEVINNRGLIEENVRLYTEQFGETIPRPPHWGGYIVHPTAIEFWQGRSNRLHDRLLYRLQTNQSWTQERLAP